MNGENKNGRIQAIAIVVSILLSLGSLAKSVFFAGGNEGATQEHLKNDDRRLDDYDRRFERDEARLDTQIEIMRDNLDRQKEALNEQRRFNEYLQSQLSGRKR